MKKDTAVLENTVVWIPDSKTPNAVAEVPLTDLAAEPTGIKCSSPATAHSVSERGQHDGTPDHVQDGVAVDASASEGAGLSHLRSAVDLNDALTAGGVADEWGAQLIGPGDAKVFKKYSQMKLQMKREALQKLTRATNKSAGLLGQRDDESGYSGTATRVWDRSGTIVARKAMHANGASCGKPR